MRLFTTNAEENLKEDSITTIPGIAGEMTLVKMYPAIQYQTVKGIGGAVTEAAAYTYARMGEDNKKKLVDLYFGEDGINYNLIRMHIQSCDFAIDNYQYVSDPEDRNLDTFNMDRDRKYILPLLKDILSRGKDIEYIATPWSPPTFMKTNNDMNHGGKLKEEFADMWADMIVRYIQEYEKEGIRVARISTQNEPAATQTWDSCCYSAVEEGVFIRDHLKPALVKAGYGDIKIGIWDHNKELLVERVGETLGVEGVAECVDSIFFHWYSGDHFEQVSEMSRRYPDKELVFTEGCVEYSRYNSTNPLVYAEMYAHEMIGDFNAGMEAFTDWNIYLDEMGGPNHVGNYCDAPVMCDTKTDEVNVQKSFYYIGHFSKFVKRGAKRVMTSKCTDKIETVGFVNPDGEKVLIVLNKTESDVKVNVADGTQYAECEFKAHSISTLCW